MLCRITHTFNGSQDGIDVRMFVAGETVELSSDLSREAINAGWAIHAEKSIGAAPHNKDLGAAPLNKATVSIETSGNRRRGCRVANGE